MTLQSRLRPAPGRHTPKSNPTTIISTALAPDFHDADDSSDIEESPEDLFSSFLAHLFPDDAPQFHGDPGQHLRYSSPRYGELEIMVPSWPGETKNEDAQTETEKKEGSHQAEEGRRLFAHHLWTAGMLVAEGVENADCKVRESESAAQKETRDIWSVQGETVLELGAGAALPSLICALANASHVVATDHPSSPALAGAIEFNMKHNFLDRQPSPSLKTTVAIQPHAWGVLADSFSQSHKGAFTRIIAADCYWMRSQHENLIQTMQWFLAPGGKVWCVAGFHTARPIVAGFFEMVLESGFEIERIFERDVVSRGEQGEEIRREWVPFREGEGPENLRRWCVIAVLKRKGE